MGYGQNVAYDETTLTKNAAGQGQIGAGYGLLSARPVAGTAGRFYYATDTNTWYYDTGAAWVTVAASSVANTFSQLITFQAGLALNPALADSAAAGKLFLSSTTANYLKYYDAASTLHQLATLDANSIPKSALGALGIVPADLGTITDGATLDQVGAGNTLEVKANGIGTAKIAAKAVTAEKMGNVVRLIADVNSINGTQSTGLTWALAASTNYKFRAVLFLFPGGGSGENFQIHALAAGAALVFTTGLAFATGATMVGSAVVGVTTNIFSSNLNFGPAGATAIIEGLITVGATPTTLQIDQVDNGVGDYVKAGSFLEVSAVA